MKLLSTKAVCNSHGEDSSYFTGWQEYEKNPYDSTRNSTGIIQMGLAENQLSSDLLELWLDENPEATSFKRNGKSIFRELALFQDYHGLPAFKQSLVSFMSKVRGNKVNFNADNLVVTAGATSANEILVFCLAEPGEAFLLPTPYYPGFDRDLKWRTGVEIVPVQCCSNTGFRVTGMALEEAWGEAQKRGLKVKGVLITNPSNPLGTTATIDELHLLLAFVSTKSIHLISDEIYAGTVFGPPRFVSVFEAFEKRRLNKNNSEQKNTAADLRNRIHIVCSLSKDLGLPGFRVGGIYSNNKAVVAAATKMSSFGLVSSPTQYLLSAMLSDNKFAAHYLVENKRRLKRRNEMLVKGLAPAGIRCLEGNSGLFSWVDMRHLLKRKTMKGEMNLWRKMLYSVGINISPGSSCHCSEPGWFRVCFANMSDDTLLLALNRIKQCAEGSTGRKRCLRNWVLRSATGEEEREEMEEKKQEDDT